MQTFVSGWMVCWIHSSHSYTHIHIHRDFCSKPTLAIIKLNVLYTVLWCIWPHSCVMNMEKVAHSRKYDSLFFSSHRIFISIRFILLKSSEYNLCCIKAHCERCYFKPLNSLIEKLTAVPRIHHTFYHIWKNNSTKEFIFKNNFADLFSKI